MEAPQGINYEGVEDVPTVKRKMNGLGLWLNGELDRRGLLLQDLAEWMGIAPATLSHVTRGNKYSDETMGRWKERFETALSELDKEGKDK